MARPSTLLLSITRPRARLTVRRSWSRGGSSDENLFLTNDATFLRDNDIVVTRTILADDDVLYASGCSFSIWFYTREKQQTREC